VLVQEQQLITLSFHGADDGVEFFGGTVNTSLSMETKMTNLIGLKMVWNNTNWYGN
jgi:hypothetical protein